MGRLGDSGLIPIPGIGIGVVLVVVFVLSFIGEVKGVSEWAGVGAVESYSDSVGCWRDRVESLLSPRCKPIRPSFSTAMKLIWTRERGRGESLPPTHTKRVSVVLLGLREASANALLFLIALESKFK